MASFKKKGIGSNTSHQEINVENGLSKDSNQVIRLGGSLVQEETSIVPDVNDTKTLRFGTFSKFLNLFHSVAKDFYAFAMNVMYIRSENRLSILSKNACTIKSDSGNLFLEGDRGILLKANDGNNYELVHQAGNIRLNNALSCDKIDDHQERLFLKANEVYLASTHSSTDNNTEKRAYFMYDLETDRIIYANGSGKFKFIANLDDLGQINNESSTHSITTFYHNNWIGSNFLLKTEGTNLFFHTIKKASTLKSITINGGEIGSNEGNKTLTFILYQVSANNDELDSSSKRSISSLQDHAIFSGTTSIVKDHNSGTDFQKVFEGLDIQLETYSKLYVGITTNNISSLHNLSITLEYF